MLAIAPDLTTGGDTVAGKVAAGAGLGYASDVAQAANNDQQSIFKLRPRHRSRRRASNRHRSRRSDSEKCYRHDHGSGKRCHSARHLVILTKSNTAIDQFAKTPEAKQQLVDTAKDSINNYLQTRSQQFGEGISKMVASEPIDKQSVVDSFANAVSKFGGQVKDGALVFGDTALNSAEQKTVSDVFDTVKGWKDVTPQGMDTLRQRIGAIA